MGDYKEVGLPVTVGSMDAVHVKWANCPSRDFNRAQGHSNASPITTNQFVMCLVLSLDHAMTNTSSRWMMVFQGFKMIGTHQLLGIISTKVVILRKRWVFIYYAIVDVVPLSLRFNFDCIPNYHQHRCQLHCYSNDDLNFSIN